MKIAIIVFPGTNREKDIRNGFVNVGVRAEQISFIWHREQELPTKIDLVVLPGGFSYGDYLRCGAMAAHSPIMREVKAASERGVAVLGVCNGFQILCETGLLPGVLLCNNSLKFVCKQVRLTLASTNSPFTHSGKLGSEILAPVAHHDGNYFATKEQIKELEDHDRVVFRYDPLDNPNGSLNHIAGITNHNRRVLGLMPHLENATDPLAGGIDGRLLFESFCS